ncbi:carcinoembryonic antigen-related cell adhesion molecule 5-like [Tachysurus fulvidraco]|uniref:carcinoembryonic antigen-related cell adhesion molecule 5-like n=1 Tax=Tachysurus fulvidraco TaxID=1234273 RepID=UPI001FED96F5|nr:carcinoembryonic antigen-related cell adhesion molecule 5-like [Tachysurus fulvidraco]
MEQVMMVILFITLLKGFNQEQILLPSAPINKEVGASVLFTVMPFSQPISTIIWNFNDNKDFIIYVHPTETVIPPYQGRVILNHTTGELELQNLTMADSGKYTLTVKFNNFTEIANHTFLQVFEPVISLGITGPEGYLIEYNSANFTCEGNGTITTTMWMKDNENLDSSSSITFLDDNRTLVITPLLRTDTGNYQCKLSNPVSSSTAHYRILINYGPDVRILGLQTFEEGSDILLLCLPYSEPPPTATWTVNGIPSRTPLLYVTENSKPNNSGDYNCTCSNSVTGITASAVQYVTVRPVSSRLGPGAEAGITLSVIFLVVILAILTYFFIKHHRKQANPVREVPIQMVSDQQTNQNTGKNNKVEAQTPTHVTSVDTPVQNNRTRQPIYQNRPNPPPTPPLPRGRPPLLPARQTNDAHIYCTAVG